MKKAILCTCCILLLPVFSFAGEKMLLEIAGDMITLADATISCAASAGACTEADALALQADAENGLRDIAGVVKSGNLISTEFAPEHILLLYSKLQSLQSRLAQSGLFQNTCNFGIHFLSQSLSLIGYGLAYILIAIVLHPPGGQTVLGILLGILCIVTGIVLVPAACLVLLTCFFWWL
jgi:hypothetical protein